MRRKRVWIWMFCTVLLMFVTTREIHAAGFAGGSGQLGCWTSLQGDVGPNHYVQVYKDCNAETWVHDRCCSAPGDCTGSACTGWGQCDPQHSTYLCNWPPNNHDTVAIYQKEAHCCSEPGVCGDHNSPTCGIDADCQTPGHLNDRCNWPIKFPMGYLAGNVEGCASGLAGDYGGADPTVIYDQFADRWFLAEIGGFGNCVYVSKTGNPAAGYPNFQSMQANWTVARVPWIGDYPRWGLWPISKNCQGSGGDPTSGCGSYVGSSLGILALDRGKLLAGPGPFVSDCTGSDPVCQSFNSPSAYPKPADIDGFVPPANDEPAVVLGNFDGAYYGGSDRVTLSTVDVDWGAQPPVDYVSLNAIDIPMSPFESRMCDDSVYGPGYSPCIKQPDTSFKLAPYTQFPMDRLTYRNRGTREAPIPTLVGNFTVNAVAWNPNNHNNDRAAVRWFELRKGSNWTGCSSTTHSGAWDKCQEGTLNGSGANRWVGSAAMNGAGSIGAAYNVSWATGLYPSLRYTGRLSTASPGGMGVECTLRQGDTYTSYEAWNLSTTLNVDPTDDLTFWFTGQYMKNTNPGNTDHNLFSTWISSFRITGLPVCELQQE